MRRILVAACFAFGAAIGCSGPGEPQPTAEEAPDAFACASDAECAPGPLVDPDDLCCDTGMALRVFSRRYLDWRAAAVRASCGGHTCPSMPPPTPPRSCALEPRCVAGRCDGSCDTGQP